jgi:phage/plasmid-like protein (TIGR03299 family)
MEDAIKNISQEELDKFLVTNKLDFTVEMKPQVALIGEEYLQTGGYVPMRTDTNTFLSKGGLSKDFTPIQNRDALGIIRQLSGVTNIELKNSGIWSGGAGVFAQVSLGDTGAIGGNDDRVGKYLSVVNSHDGSRALAILITPYRFFCKNQLAKAYNKAKKSDDMFITIRHNASAEEKMEELIRTVRIADDVFKYTEDVYQKLATLKINTDAFVEETFRKIFPINSDAGLHAQTIWANRIAKAKARFENADDGRIEKNTAWNLYNAVQGTIQHDSRGSNNYKSILMGEIADRSEKALSTVLELCSSEHIPHSIMSEIDQLTK